MIPGVEGLPPVEMKAIRGIVHYEFLLQGQTVNQHVYKEILQQESHAWLLHTALSIWTFLVEKNIKCWSSPYLPDLAPCDFFLFLKIKNTTKGTHVVNMDAIKNAVTKEL